MYENVKSKCMNIYNMYSVQEEGHHPALWCSRPVSDMLFWWLKCQWMCNNLDDLLSVVISTRRKRSGCKLLSSLFWSMPAISDEETCTAQSLFSHISTFVGLDSQMWRKWFLRSSDEEKCMYLCAKLLICMPKMRKEDLISANGQLD